MNQDPLHSLLRLRQSELDAGRRRLGEAIVAEDRARAARRAADDAILAETRLAAASDGDHDVEQFAQWLKRGRASLRAAEAALDEAVGVSAYQRAELTLLRAAVEATAQAIERKQTAAEAARARAAQRDLDELGTRRAFFP
jgi:flagellar biosynthesis chaperone FliJ